MLKFGFIQRINIIQKMEGHSSSSQSASQPQKRDGYLAVHRSDSGDDHSTGDHYSHGPPQKRSRSNSSVNQPESPLHSFQYLDFSSNQSSAMNGDDEDKDSGLVDVSEDEDYNVQEGYEILESSSGIMSTQGVYDTCFGMVSLLFLFLFWF